MFAGWNRQAPLGRGQTRLQSHAEFFGLEPQRLLEGGKRILFPPLDRPDVGRVDEFARELAGADEDHDLLDEGFLRWELGPETGLEAVFEVGRATSRGLVVGAGGRGSR